MFLVKGRWRASRTCPNLFTPDTRGLHERLSYVTMSHPCVASISLDDAKLQKKMIPTKFFGKFLWVSAKKVHFCG